MSNRIRRHHVAAPAHPDHVADGDVGVGQAGAAAGFGSYPDVHAIFGGVLVDTVLDNFRRPELHVQVGVTLPGIGVLAGGDFQFDQEFERWRKKFWRLVEARHPIGQIPRTALKTARCDEQGSALGQFAILGNGLLIDHEVVEQQLNLVGQTFV
ncbi:hypothetical protein [Pseudomonas glycinae]|uniref:hypothetical protein n=1 Tax=Pseudomonas glycinae TaxID=1785145 RepID=UPI00167EAD0C|nr:hypothetical protein [Pseudomonas glycinae]